MVVGTRSASDMPSTAPAPEVQRNVRTQEVDDERRHAHDRLLLLLDCGTVSAF